MKKTGLLIGLILTLITISAAQEQKGRWSIQIIPTYTDMYKNSDVMARKFNAQITVENYRFAEYKIDYSPFTVIMPPKTHVRVNISYTTPRWKFGAYIWQFSSSRSLNDTITTPKPVIRLGGNGIFYNNGAEMWEHTIFSLTNLLEESGRSRVWLWLKNRIYIITGGTYMSKNITRFFNIRLGLMFAQIQNRQNIGQKQRAYIHNYHGYAWDNWVTLKQTADSKYITAGPSFGLNLHTTHFGIFFKQALLFGKTNYPSLLEDTDDIIRSNPDTKEDYETIRLYGRFPFSYAEKIAIPYTELHMNLMTKPKNIGKKVSLKFGIDLSASIFWHAPIAYRWSVPGQWTWGGVTGWKMQKRNLLFTGIAASIEINF